MTDYDNNTSERSDAERAIIREQRKQGGAYPRPTIAQQVAKDIEWVVADKSTNEPYFVY